MTDSHPFADDRIDNLNQLADAGYDVFPASHLTPSDISTFCNTYTDQSEIADETEWMLAGRITRKNEFGDFAFYDIEDGTDTVQVMVRRGDIDDYDVLDSYVDYGDYIQFTGIPGRSNTGEITLFATDFSPLSKALTHLPDTQSDLSPREHVQQRTAALTTDDSLHNSVRVRFEVQEELRTELTSREFLEVETPTFHTEAGGAEATAFETQCEALDSTLALRIAPELYLKRLITAGYPRVFEMARCYRNEDIDTTHNPEFTMLELYQAHADYEDMMELTENIIATVARTVTGSEIISYDGEDIDLNPPWKRQTFDALVDEHFAVPVESLSNTELRSHLEQSYNEACPETATRDELLMEVFEHAVEPTLDGPTFVMDYPTVSTPLCREHTDNPDRVQRFEAFVHGIEVGNAYTELTDPRAQRERLIEQAGGVEDAINEDFVAALANGMPPTGGLGIGVDRVAMLLTDSQSIKEVLPFPLTETRI